jgi:hypothetical protein
MFSTTNYYTFMFLKNEMHNLTFVVSYPSVLNSSEKNAPTKISPLRPRAHWIALRIERLEISGGR